MRSVVQRKHAGFLHFKELSNFENISNRNTLLIERAHLNIYKIIVYTAIITKFKDVRAHRVVGPRNKGNPVKERVQNPFHCHFVIVSVTTCTGPTVLS